MNELHFAHRIRQILNRGTQQIEQPTLDRLAQARLRALEFQRQEEPRRVLAGFGRYFSHQHEEPHRWRRLLATLALLAGMLLGAYWHGQQQIADLEEVDSELLSDDLPINAYLDKGFDAWLKRDSAQ